MDKETKKPNQDQLPEEFITDSQKIVQRHLKDENDVITEQDIRGVRIGVTPPHDVTSHKKIEEIIDKVETESKNKKDDGISRTDDPVTPWDAIQH